VNTGSSGTDIEGRRRKITRFVTQNKSVLSTMIKIAIVIAIVTNYGSTTATTSITTTIISRQ